MEMNELPKLVTGKEGKNNNIQIFLKIITANTK